MLRQTLFGEVDEPLLLPIQVGQLPRQDRMQLMQCYPLVGHRFMNVVHDARHEVI